MYIGINLLLFLLYYMFKSFFRFFGPRQIALLSAFTLFKLTPYLATSEEN